MEVLSYMTVQCHKNSKSWG